MKQFIKAILLFFVLLFSFIHVSYANQDSDLPFKDINSHWSKSYVEKLYKLGVYESKKTFNPDEKIKRAELIKIIMKAFGHGTGSVGLIRFQDVDANSWYAPYLGKAIDIGIVDQGKSKASFNSTGYVTKAEGLKLVLKASGISLKKGTKQDIKDVKTSDWFYDYANFALYSSLISLDKNGNFNPGNLLTRGQITKIISQVLDLKDGKKIVNEEAMGFVKKYKDLTKKFSPGALQGKLTKEDYKISRELKIIYNKLKISDKNSIDLILKLNVSEYDIDMTLNDIDLGIAHGKNGTYIKRYFSLDSIMKLIVDERLISKNFILKKGKNVVAIKYKRKKENAKLIIDLYAYQSDKIVHFDINDKEGYIERSFMLDTVKPDKIKLVEVIKK